LPKPDRQNVVAVAPKGPPVRSAAPLERLLVLRDAPLHIGEATKLDGLAARDLSASVDAPPVHPNPLSLRYPHDGFEVTVTYTGSPAIAAESAAQVAIALRNPHPEPLRAQVALRVPSGWSVRPKGAQGIDVGAREEQRLTFSVRVDEASSLRNSNRALLEVVPEARPAEPAIPVVFVGARRWQIWGPRPMDAASPADALDAPQASDQQVAGDWRTHSAPDNALPLPEDWTGIVDARLHVHSPRRQEVRLGIPGTSPRRLWLNGTSLHTVREASLLRPNYGGDHVSYVDTTLEEGWNSVVIRYVRTADLPPFAAHFTLATTGLYHGIYDVGWTQAPTGSPTDTVSR
jgi:hypothetical protein